MTDQNDMFGGACGKRSVSPCGTNHGETCVCYQTIGHGEPHRCVHCGTNFRTQAEGVKEGERLRDEAVEQVSQGKRNWVADCRKAMVTLYRTRRAQMPLRLYVNGDDAVEWLEREGYTGDNRVVGAVFKGGWQNVGTVKSRLPKRHARPITCWIPKRQGKS